MADERREEEEEEEEGRERGRWGEGRKARAQAPGGPTRPAGEVAAAAAAAAAAARVPAGDLASSLMMGLLQCFACGCGWGGSVVFASGVGSGELGCARCESHVASRES